MVNSVPTRPKSITSGTRFTAHRFLGGVFLVVVMAHRWFLGGTIIVAVDIVVVVVVVVVVIVVVIVVIVVVLGVGLVVVLAFVLVVVWVFVHFGIRCVG